MSRLAVPSALVVAAACTAGVLLSLPASAEDASPAGSRECGPVAVGELLRTMIEADWTERDRQFGSQKPAPVTVADGSPRPVTTAEDAAGGCDGIKNGRCGFHTASNEIDPWWQADLGRTYRLDRVVVFNRTDGNTAPRTKQLRVLVASDAAAPEFRQVYQHDGETFYGIPENRPLVVELRQQQVTARIVRLQVPGRCSFALDEVEVYSAEDGHLNIARGKPADQKSISPYSARSPARSDPAEAQAPDLPVSAFSLQHTREVLDRGRTLAARIALLAGAGAAEPALNADSSSPDETPAARLGRLVAQLAGLEARLDQLAFDSSVPEKTRRAIHFEARWLARKIAFCNPLFEFDKILFIKRHHPGGLYHMVHQYYGFGAKSGGGLFVLADAFSENPRLTDVLAGARVSGGRLAGRELAPGSFLSPELSYDGRTILFAYTECGAQGIEWSPQASYHIFRCGLDGSGLVQLTDGSWNEFDPCFLPNGRIVFISERRGGYLRCGGSAPPYDSPTYTLHSMGADGSDLQCLSFHETQEWQPSVTNDGQILYTRWDYVDRDTNVAHHIWTCSPDGRDPRSFHGNYPVRRESRPWMEMDARAIPGSPRFVATAAAHHGHALGSLVLIDPRQTDDGAMSQLTRLTPDVPFPESEGGKSLIRSQMAYGAAWPLSEDDYLCVYDSEAKNHGIYWIDRFGNRELLYRDPEIPCLSPIPVRCRPTPPTLPDRSLPSAAGTEQLAVEFASSTVSAPADSSSRSAAFRPLPSARGATIATGTLAVANVYDSDFAWPEGSRVAALRIMQVLPKTTPPANQPRIGIGSQTNARAVLGTVPVEADGSAYFELQAGKAVYFQALDERGLAIQSMRSATYLHPGEQLTCRGCHEPKHRSPEPIGPGPLALQRPPSKIQPDVDGSNPFNYVRLVQPVLDRHCVSCHREQQALDLTGAGSDQHGWTRSYTNLAGKFGFYFDVNNGTINSGVHGGSRTVAGQFGARAAPLTRYLDEQHYGVALSPEDYHRVTLWLDCNSEFYGAYEHAAAQARGELVQPALD